MRECIHAAHEAPDPLKRKSELFCFFGDEQAGLKAVWSIHKTGLWQSLVDQVWLDYQEAGRLETLRREGLLDEGGQDDTGMVEMSAAATSAPDDNADEEATDAPGMST